MIQDITLANGLEQKVAEFNLPPGSLLSAINCRQNRNGSLSKRPGNTKLTNQYQSSQTSSSPASIDVSLGGALASYGNQLLLTTNAGTAVYSPMHSTFGPYNYASEALVTRSGTPTPSAVNAAGTSALGGVSLAPAFYMEPTVTTDGTYLFYVWIGRFNKGFMSIVDIATGVAVRERVPWDQGDSPVWAVPIMVGTQFTIVYNTSAGAIKMVGFASPYTSSTPSVAVTLGSLSSGILSTCNIDAVAVGSNFAVVYGIASNVVTRLVSPAGALLAVNTTGAATDPAEVRIGYSGSGLLWSAWRLSTSNTTRILSMNAATLVATMTGAFTVVATGSNCETFAIMPYNSTQCVVAACILVTNQMRVEALLFDSTLSAGAGGIAIDVVDSIGASVLASKPFMQGGKTYCWVQTYSQSAIPSAQSIPSTSRWGVSGSLNQNQFSNILVDLRMDTGVTGTTLPSRPVAIDAPRFAYPVPNRQLTQGNNIGLGQTISPLSLVSAGSNKWLATLGAREGGAYTSKFYAITADFASPVRWKTVVLGNLDLQSSGLVMDWDGERSFENGFVQNVAQMSAVGAGGPGSLIPSTNYYYRVVPMFVDSQGNVHRGIPSALCLLATNGTATNLTITWASYQVTDKTYLASNGVTFIKSFWEIYRSQGGASGTSDIATNLVDIIENDPSAATISYVDGIVDTNVAPNALCYTFGGALPNGCPPGALDIVAHEGRAWIIDDTGGTLYFSKQIVDGEAVNFTDSFTVPLDDQGIALASMDDKLIIFTKRRIYYLIGLGPNDDGSGTGYDIPQRVHSPVGCIDRRSVVATPDGIMFQSSIGLYLLDRGLNVSFVGQPVADELATYPVVVSANLHPSQPWVYFYVTNAAGNAGERLVFDYRIGQWYTDTLAGVPLSAASVNNGAHYWLDTTGQVWAEDTTGAVFKDNSVWVTMHFETAWQPTQAGKQGWGSLDRLQLLAKKLAPCDAVLSLRQNYQPSASSSFLYFDSAAQPKLPTVEIEMINPPGKQEAFTIAYTDYAPTDAASSSGQGWEVDSMTFQLTAIDEDAKLNRLNDAQRGKRLT